MFCVLVCVGVFWCFCFRTFVACCFRQLLVRCRRCVVNPVAVATILTDNAHTHTFVGEMSCPRCGGGCSNIDTHKPINIKATTNRGRQADLPLLLRAADGRNNKEREDNPTFLLCCRWYLLLLLLLFCCRLLLRRRLFELEVAFLSPRSPF